MIVDEAKEQERRAAEEVAYVLADIETEVGIETAAVRAEITTAEGGEATSDGVDEQTVIAPTDHPSDHRQQNLYHRLAIEALCYPWSLYS